MKTTHSVAQLEEEIGTIKQRLLALGPMHPGSVSRQYQVCGNPACRCMHPKHPQRHGPYYKLAYVYRGKPACRFVRAECVDGMKTRLAAYKEFRALGDRWIDLSIQLGIIQFFSPSPKKASKRRR